MCPVHKDNAAHQNAKNTPRAALAICNAGAAMQLVLLSGAPPIAKPVTTPTLVPAPMRLAAADDALIELDRVPHARPPKA
jgi:hypothetical protein